VLSGLFGFVWDAGGAAVVLGAPDVVVVACAKTVVENVDCKLELLLLMLPLVEDAMVSVETTVLPAELVVVTVSIPPTTGTIVEMEVTVLPAESVVVTDSTDATVVVITELVRTVLVDGAMVVVTIDPSPYEVEPSSIVAGYASVTVLPPAKVVVSKTVVSSTIAVAVAGAVTVMGAVCVLVHVAVCWASALETAAAGSGSPSS